MNTLRSEDWSVRPSFVPGGPTSPVTLLFGEEGLTQLAGIPPVAWQTPWGEIHSLQLTRSAYVMSLFATVGDVRYCWRQRSLSQFDALSALVVSRGGSIARRRSRFVVGAVVAVVVVATFAAGFAAWLSSSGANVATQSARAVNLTLRDLPSGWYATNNGVLSYLVPSGTQVFTSTTTTAPAKNGAYERAAGVFQRCLNVSNRADRVYGLAGQQPDAQVSSMIFNTNTLGGVELATTAQYYHTSTMVRRDTREMSRPNFGRCFTASSAALIDAQTGAKIVGSTKATNWRPVTFLRGWSRGGVMAVTVPGVVAPLQLVTAVVTRGHYEVTLNALVGSFARTESLLASLVNTLEARVSSTSSSAV